MLVIKAVSEEKLKYWSIEKLLKERNDVKDEIIEYMGVTDKEGFKYLKYLEEYLKSLEEYIEERENFTKKHEPGYYYLTVVYKDDASEKKYNYLSVDDTIVKGTMVYVDRENQKVLAKVVDADYYTRKNAPYPLEKTKYIICTEEEDESKIDDILKINEQYRRLTLNIMFGRIYLKDLMNLLETIDKEMVENFEIYYYPKFNIFIRTNSKEKKFSVWQYSCEILTMEMVRIIIEDCVKLPLKDYSKMKDNKRYVEAFKFCENNKLPYYDDTDVMLYYDEKKDLKHYKEYKEPKIFKDIDEIIDYVDKMEEPKYKVGDPDYYIHDDKIVHVMGYLDYDSRLFKIPEFLVKNGYVFEEYYDIEKNPDLFNEDYHTWDFSKIGIEKVSYVILRTFNIERIFEGAIAEFFKSGCLLKALKRAKALKK